MPRVCTIGHPGQQVEDVPPGSRPAGMQALLDLREMYTTGHEVIQALRIFMFSRSIPSKKLELSDVRVFCAPSSPLPFYEPQMVGVLAPGKVEEKKESVETGRGAALHQVLELVAQLASSVASLNE